jgi:uncharacterized protein YoxC
MTAEEHEILLQKVSNTTGLKGIIVRLGTKAAILAEKLGLGSLLPSKAADITATKGQTAANWSLWASLGPILIVVVALTAALIVIIGLILIIVGLIKTIKANSPEARLEALNKIVADAAKNATAAKEAYDALNTSITSLNDKYEELDNLAEGTREWNAALIEVNGQVLKLIDEYPELANYLTNSNGILKIDEEGFAKILEKQSNVVVKS